MNKIRIIACPPGEAPESVRKAWIGLELPLGPEPFGRRRNVAVIGGVLTEPRSRWKRILALVLGRFERRTGYLVNSLDAVNILAASNPDAAKWWRDHCSYLLDGRRRFVFAAHVCEEC